MGAYTLLALAIFHSAQAHVVNLGRPAARRALVLLALILIQASLGVATLLLAVPLWAGLLHQAVAFVVLIFATLHRRRIG